MWRRSWATFRGRVVSLLLLALILVHAAPSHSCQAPRPGTAPGHHAMLAQPSDGTPVAATDHAHHTAPSRDAAQHADGPCCGMAHCTPMPSALPAAAVLAFAPRLSACPLPDALATPDGIGVDPALRPPCPVL